MHYLFSFSKIQLKAKITYNTSFYDLQVSNLLRRLNQQLSNVLRVIDNDIVTVIVHIMIIWHLFISDKYNRREKWEIC